MDGPLATADVSFGQWDLDTPLDRFPNNSPRERNYHHLTPDVFEIKAGGAVNFHIAGFHHILIYDDGTKPGDINIAAVIPSPSDVRSQCTDQGLQTKDRGPWKG